MIGSNDDRCGGGSSRGKACGAELDPSLRRGPHTLGILLHRRSGILSLLVIQITVFYWMNQFKGIYFFAPVVGGHFPRARVLQFLQRNAKFGSATDSPYHSWVYLQSVQVIQALVVIELTAIGSTGKEGVIHNSSLTTEGTQVNRRPTVGAEERQVLLLSRTKECIRSPGLGGGMFCGRSDDRGPGSTPTASLLGPNIY